MPDKYNELAVSVIIPVYNASSTLPLCLESITNQSIDRNGYEIIAIDNGSTDNSPSIIESYNLPYYLATAKKSAGAARNHGIHLAKGELIIFLDSDCIANYRLVEQYMDKFKQLYIEGVNEPVIGGGIDGYNRNIWSYCDDICSWYRYCSRLPGRIESSFFPTANLCLRKTALIRAGMFNPDLTAGEDFAICQMLKKTGCTLFFEPAIKAKHINRDSFHGILSHHKSWARSDFILKELEYKKDSKAPFPIFLLSSILYFFAKMIEIYLYLFLAKKFFSIFLLPVIAIDRFIYCLNASIVNYNGKYKATHRFQ